MSIFRELADNFRRFTNRKAVAVVHDEDLVSLLTELGLWDEIQRGAATCGHCGVQITFENLGGWAKMESDAVLFCDDEACLARLSLLSDEDSGAEEPR